VGIESSAAPAAATAGQQPQQEEEVEPPPKTKKKNNSLRGGRWRLWEAARYRARSLGDSQYSRVLIEDRSYFGEGSFFDLGFFCVVRSTTNG
jgi:hypothetical protein